MRARRPTLCPLLLLVATLAACANTESNADGDASAAQDAADNEVDGGTAEDDATAQPDADEPADVPSADDAVDADDATGLDAVEDVAVGDVAVEDIDGVDDADDGGDTGATEPDSESPGDASGPADAITTDVEADIESGADADVTVDVGTTEDTAGTPDVAPDVVIPPPVCVDTASIALPATDERTYMDGTHETVRVGGFTDEYLVDAAGYIQVGIRPEWGGSIVFYGLRNGSSGPNNSNTIDANDTGREVQVALYDPDRLMQGCAWNASCRTGGTPCANSIRFLGWNPVQGGSRCNRGPGLENLEFSDGALRATVVPLQWNPDWDQSSCGGDLCSNAALRDNRSDVRIVQSLRFVRTHVVELDYTIYNLAPVDHAITEHELPTLYSANGNNGPDLWRLMTADGRQIDINEPANDGFFYRNLDSGSPWVTLQNDTLTYGVGLFMENGLTQFQGWQNRSLPFNNFRARFPFAVPANGVIRARAYLILGAFDTQRAEAEWLTANLPPFGAMDAPRDVAEDLSGETIRFSGWALDNQAGTSVSVIVDGALVVPLTSEVPRTDVCSVWPGYPACPAPGFGGEVPRTAFGDTRCAHVLDVVATDSNGNRTHLGRRVIPARP